MHWWINFPSFTFIIRSIVTSGVSGILQVCLRGVFPWVCAHQMGLNRDHCIHTWYVHCLLWYIRVNKRVKKHTRGEGSRNSWMGGSGAPKTDKQNTRGGGQGSRKGRSVVIFILTSKKTRGLNPLPPPLDPPLTRLSFINACTQLWNTVCLAVCQTLGTFTHLQWHHGRASWWAIHHPMFGFSLT